MRKVLGAVLALALLPAVAMADSLPSVGGDGTRLIAPPGGTVLRTLSQRIADCAANGTGCYVYYAHDYGWLCDGSTDNTANGAEAALLAAVNATQGGVLVQFPQGDCRYQGYLKFTAPYVWVFGAGNGTVLDATVPANDAVIFSPTSPDTASIYGGGIFNMRIARPADVGSGTGAGLHLIRMVGFQSDGLELDEHYGGLLVEGGSHQRFVDLAIGSGRYWTANTLKSGSYYARFIPYISTGGTDLEHPSEIFIDQPNWKTENQGTGTGQSTTPVVDRGLDIQGMDGLWITGGHIGFTANDFYAQPQVNNEGIISVFSTNVMYDGNDYGTTGISIPAWTTTGNYMRDIVFTGGSVPGHTGAGAYVNASSAENIRFDGTVFYANGGWCADIEAAKSIAVSGQFKTCGTTVNNTGGLKVVATTANLGQINFDGVGSGIGGNVTTGDVCLYLVSTGLVTMPSTPTFNSCPTNGRITVGANITLRWPATSIAGTTTWANVLFMQPNTVTGMYGGFSVDVAEYANTSNVGTGSRRSSWQVWVPGNVPQPTVIGTDATVGTPPGFTVNANGNNVQVRAESNDGTNSIFNGTIDLTLHFAYTQSGPSSPLTWTW